jgi:glucan phosphoethanolaminetransferase (alkaline phosphatase superfamily)
MNLKINRIIPRKYRIPAKYSRLVSIGYFSIILLYLSVIVDILLSSSYGTANGNIEGLLIKILQIIGAVIFVYAILMIGSKLKTVKSKKSKLKTHYNILFGFFIGFLILSILLRHYNLI